MGMVQGVRLWFLLKVKVCRRVSPWKKPEGMEEKLFLSRKRHWREVRLAREGIGPESERFWRERMVSRVRVPRSEGTVPVRD